MMKFDNDFETSIIARKKKEKKANEKKIDYGMKCLGEQVGKREEKKNSSRKANSNSDNLNGGKT